MAEDIALSRRLLVQFLAVVGEGHFGRAAEQLGMSQPPLSQSIQRLERMLGVRLLERGPTGARPTAAGEVFAADARRLLDLQTAAVARARRVADGVEGDIRIGYVSLLSHLHLPTMLRAMADQLPGLRVQLHHGSAAAVAEQVHTGALDLGFLRDPARLPDELVSTVVATERIQAAVPDGHRLAGADEIALSALRDEDFAMPDPTALPVLAEQVHLACHRAGFTPRGLVLADELSGLFSYVAAGLCVSLLPEGARHFSTGGVSFLPLRGDAGYLDTTIQAVHRPDADPTVARLLQVVTGPRSPWA
ncbi:LysR family transcriptional regulator [Streptomyces varsoviensis]|uniref:LysR family transcriptional regulator n=2 Tax=Streptomyces varsoviensis TaxID=67373 RepID=A0ABR5JBK2_9ACTN|nr:LysR family transcriptional regulator [Streptomyces varsoviensis]